MKLEQAYLPYAGTSGHSGSETSKARAIQRDSDGTTRNNQERTEVLLRLSWASGLTWKELSDLTGWHHGTASGVLSVLHKSGAVLRLKQTRKKCAIYVLPGYREGREIAQPKPPKTCHNCGAEQ